MNAYNFERFEGSRYEFNEFEGPRAGERPPDVELYRTDGSEVRLSDLRGERVALETGSATCPLYARSVDAMNRLANRFPEITFLVLYVREAHPGERMGAHTSLQEKIRRAATLEERFGEQREVLVDAVDGKLHCALGGLPNMVYLLDEEGRVAWRADWHRPELLEDHLSNPEARKLADWEHFEPTPAPLSVSFPTMLEGGWRAIWDFVVELPRLAWRRWRP